MVEPIKNINKKRMIKMLIFTGILFGGIFIYKLFGAYMFSRYMANNKAPAVTVATIKVGYSDWQSDLKFYASLRAIKGVNVTTELPGLVQTIYFTKGQDVKQGTILVQLNADAETAELASLQAKEDLAKITYDRDEAEYKIKAISKETLDSDYANLESLKAQVSQQAATVIKKTIVAPFAGRLGISTINPGQYLNAGDMIAPLQDLDQMYADFYVPQQELTKLQVGQTVNLTVDTFPGQTFSGEITTINPVLDTTTRNVEVEATFANPNKELVSGMSGNVIVTTGTPQKLLTLPQAAITFNPYGDIVYIIKQDGKNLTATQTFVSTGDVRGDQIAITKGLDEGDVVVTAGQLKLKNGSTVVINNSIQPGDSATPNTANDY
jgi:membrane fusion protein (multidrug efflux system)